MRDFTLLSKKTFLLAIVIIMAIGAYAQADEPQTDEIWRHNFAIGLGPEINKHSPQGYAGGLSLNFDYN
ncbi:MAG: hypothetical protein FWD26_08405, partial [Treponema sp.]|nr:hypothetical protein [Treponema sp.]